MVLSLSSSVPHWRSLMSTSKQCGWAYSKSDFQCGSNLDIFWQCRRARSPLVVDHGRQCRFISAEVTNNKLKRPKTESKSLKLKTCCASKSQSCYGFLTWPIEVKGYDFGSNRGCLKAQRIWKCTHETSKFDFFSRNVARSNCHRLSLSLLCTFSFFTGSIAPDASVNVWCGILLLHAAQAAQQNDWFR